MLYFIERSSHPVLTKIICMINRYHPLWACLCAPLYQIKSLKKSLWYIKAGYEFRLKSYQFVLSIICTKQIVKFFSGPFQVVESMLTRVMQEFEHHIARKQEMVGHLILVIHVLHCYLNTTTSFLLLHNTLHFKLLSLTLLINHIFLHDNLILLTAKYYLLINHIFHMDLAWISSFLCCSSGVPYCFMSL